MKHISVDDVLALDTALSVLTAGGIIIMPTDTVYGIGCDATNAEASRSLFTIKGRPGDKPIPLLVSDIEMAHRVVHIPEDLARGLGMLWPGAFTGVFLARGGTNTLAIRIPRYFFLQNLIARLARPLAMTSANISGMPPHTNVHDVLRDFGGINGIGLLVDAGDLPDSMASTVVDFTLRPAKITREGMVGREELEDALRLQFQ